MKLRLEITVPSGSSFTFESPCPILRVGRNPQSELVLEGADLDMVSFNHVRIEMTPEGATVRDLAPTNGTFVNDQRVEGQAALRQGDLVRLGQTGPALRVVELDLSPRILGSSPPPGARASAGPGQQEVRPLLETLHNSTAATGWLPDGASPRSAVERPLKTARPGGVLVAAGVLIVVLALLGTLLGRRVPQGAEPAASSHSVPPPPTSRQGQPRDTQKKAEPLPEKEPLERLPQRPETGAGRCTDEGAAGGRARAGP